MRRSTPSPKSQLARLADAIGWISERACDVTGVSDELREKLKEAERQAAQDLKESESARSA